MAKDARGREVVARLVLPLPLDLAAILMRGIAETCEAAGYTDVVMLTDGPHSGAFAATPPGVVLADPSAHPAHPQSGPAAPEEGAPSGA